MLTFGASPFSGNGRTYFLPATEATMSSSTTTVPASQVFQMRVRDVLDFSVDATAWLAANGSGAALSAAQWAVASDSPKTPTISGQGFDPTGLTSAVIAAANNAAPGDVYSIDITLTVAPCPPVNDPGGFTIPARTLVRRIQIMVVAG